MNMVESLANPRSTFLGWRHTCTSFHRAARARGVGVSLVILDSALMKGQPWVGMMSTKHYHLGSSVPSKPAPA